MLSSHTAILNNIIYSPKTISSFSYFSRLYKFCQRFLSVSNKKSCFIPKKPRLIPRGEKSILFVVFAFFRQSLRNMRKGIFCLGGGLNVVRAVFVHHVKHVLGLARYGSGARGRAVALGNLFSFILVRFYSSFLVRIFYIVFVIIPANRRNNLFVNKF